MELNDSFEIFGSQEQKDTFLNVPEDTLFKIRVLDENKLEIKKIGYLLKSGTELPCEKIVQGFNLIFSTSLEVGMDGFITEFEGRDKKIWSLIKENKLVDSISVDESFTEISCESLDGKRTPQGKRTSRSFSSNAVL